MADAPTCVYDAAYQKSLPPARRGKNPVVVEMFTRAKALAVRQIESWYQELPEAWRHQFHTRLRSPDDPTFLGALWELYVHHFLAHAPGTQVIDREVPACHGKSIDFAVNHCGQRVLCEVYFRQQTQKDRQREEWLNEFNQACEKLIPPGVVLAVSWEETPSTRSEAICLAHTVAQALGKGPVKPGFALEIPLDSVRSRLTVVVHHEGAQGRDKLLLSSWKDGFIPQIFAEAVADKANEKKPCEPLPLVLFVGYDASVHPVFDELDICYGVPRWAVQPACLELIPLPRCGGLFTRPMSGGMHTDHISVAVFGRMELESTGWTCRMCGYVNPFARCKAPPELTNSIDMWLPDPDQPGVLTLRRATLREQ